MKTQELNSIPERLRNGSITEKQAMDIISRFVAENYPIYGLHKFDEDFRQDIILSLIERGKHLFQIFNPQFGDFFTFLYCYVSTLINSKVKNRVIHNLRETLNIEESIRSIGEKEIKYHRIDYNNFEVPKAPFAAKKISPEEFQKIINDLSLKSKEKTVIILALKSSYFLTDEQIDRICRLYNIKPEYFYSMIQHCKESFENKKKRYQKALERRNFAYYHHKRYKKIIELMADDDDNSLNHNYKLEAYKYKEQKHRKNWHRLNESFENGHIYLRPTTKTVANLMGICERQVNYYIKCARKDIEKENEQKLKKNDGCLE